VITHDTDVVSTLRLALAERLGLERFELWFGSGAQLVPEPGRVRVEVPFQFTLEWLRKHFRSDIEAAVAEVLGGETAVELRLNPDLADRTRGRGERDDGRESDTPKKARSSESPAGPKRPPGRRYATLDSFVVGDCNRVAHTSAGVIIRQPGSITPFFVYGPTGVGKTHLLEGIWSGVRRAPENRRVVYLSAEQFTTFFLEALQGKGLPSFRRRYRGVDLLIIDDVQFLKGKRATQEELQHTIDSLLRERRQVALAADRPPSQLDDLHAELITRFSGGLVCAIQSPDYATRLGMLEKWTKQRGLGIPEDVLELMATRSADDARQLQGALNRIQATGQALGRPITLELANEALADLFASKRQAFGLADIDRAVCDVFQMDRETLMSKRRTKAVSHPRMLAMWLARKYTRAALSEIGDHFGRRSHTTVLSAQKTVERWMRNGVSVQMPGRDCQVQETIRQLEARLRTG
jgi:chromosomal replication initiator protein